MFTHEAALIVNGSISQARITETRKAKPAFFLPHFPPHAFPNAFIAAEGKSFEAEELFNVTFIN